MLGDKQFRRGNRANTEIVVPGAGNAHEALRHPHQTAAEDPETYAMIRKADTIGTFQIESRAQMSMLPRLRPKTFYDLVVEVAIVRPGPIQGDMVHPYIRRREGKEPVHFPTPALEKVLGKTLGVPLFCGTDVQTAGRLRQLRLPASSMPASFALIAYASSWMKCHHPDVFLAAILNAQPMGFYAPAQLVRDAREHGVEVRPVDVNLSDWDCTLEATDEKYHAVRLGFCMVRSMNQKLAEQLVDRRTFGRIADKRRGRRFTRIEDVWRRAAVPVSTLQHIAAADGFRVWALAPGCGMGD